MPSKEAVDGRRLYTKAKNAHKAGDKYSKLEQFKAAEQSYAVALEHFKAAERQLTDAIKLTPEKPYPYYVRGAVRFNIPGKKDDADADFQSGSDKERQHPEWTAVLLGLLTQIQGADRTRLTEFRSSIKAP